jgi:hypothetical protein
MGFKVEKKRYYKEWKHDKKYIYLHRDGQDEHEKQLMFNHAEQ